MGRRAGKALTLAVPLMPNGSVSKVRAGFIGFGAMGRPIAARLLRAGNPVTAFARTAQAAEPLVAEGAVAAESPRGVAQASAIVVTMVTATADVEAVVLGEDGIIHGAAPGTLVVDMSTISPHGARRIAELLAARGIDMVDAPVSGGPSAAESGTLAVMAGGSAAAIARIEPLFACFARSVTHIGECGTGQIAKACNQLALCVALEGVAESLALCERLGADPSRVRAAMLNGLAASRVLDVFGERMLKRNFDNGVESRLHHKDMHIVLDLAHTLGLSLPAGAATKQSFNALLGQGGGRKDSAALLQVVLGEAVK